MADRPAAGDYYILVAQDANLCLDSLHRGTSDGDDLIMWPWEQDESQVWSLTYDSDGNASIVAARNRKAIVRGSGLDAYLTGFSSQPYPFKLADAGTTVNVHGTSYEGWYVTSTASDGYVLEGNEVQGARQGRPVNFAAKESPAAPDQYFAFVPYAKPSYPVEPGDYVIMSGKGGNLAFDACGGGTWNGTELELWPRNWMNPQTWRLRYRPDGTAELLSAWCGKCVDIPNQDVRNGVNLQLYTDNDTRAQTWAIEAKQGKTLTVDGKPYQLYLIRSTKNPKLVIEGNGLEQYVGAGTRLCVSEEETDSSDQQWAFIPVPKLRHGGVYEIRAQADPGYALDVADDANWSGANVQLYRANGTNAQKFVLSYSTDDAGIEGWTIMHVGASGQYIGTRHNALSENENVVQWSGDRDPWMRWKVLTTGTAVVNGVECPVVEFGAENDTQYMMDVQNAIFASNTNVAVHTRNETRAQRFVLYPTTATVRDRPAPYGIGLAERVGMRGYTYCQQIRGETRELYATWSCARGADPYGPSCFAMRYRARYMGGANGAWGAWGAWTAWKVPSVRTDGSQAWCTEPVRVLYSCADYRNMEVEIQVKSRGTDERANVESLTADQVCQVIYHPLIEPTTATWGVQGDEIALLLGYKTDYRWADLGFSITSATDKGRSVLRGAGKVTGKRAADGDSYLVVPPSIISRWLWNGSDGTACDSYDVGFTLSTDQWAAGFGTPDREKWTLSDNAGKPLAVTVRKGDRSNGWQSEVSFRSLGTDDVWFTVGDEAVRAERADNGSYRIPVPFGRRCYALVQTRGDDDFSVATVEVAAVDSGYRGHVFTWGNGKFACIWLDKDQRLAESRDYSADYDDHALNGRTRHIASFTGNKKVTSTVEGYIVPDMPGGYGTTLRDVEACVDARHALYRSPFGRMSKVAVLGYSSTEQDGMVKVSVDIMEEEQYAEGLS